MKNESNLIIHIANLLFSFLLIKFYILLFLLTYIFTEGSYLLSLIPFVFIAYCKKLDEKSTKNMIFCLQNNTLN